MSIVRIAFAGLLGVVLHGEATADGTNVLQLSRDSGVKLVSQSGNSSGSAFFVADRVRSDLLPCSCCTDASRSSLN